VSAHFFAAAHEADRPDRSPSGTRIALFSDVRLHREGLALVLAGTADVEVVATAAHGDAATVLARHGPDVALLDLTTDDDLNAVRSLVAATPQVSFVLLAVPELEQAILDCAEAGIVGYVTRDGSVAELVATIRAVARGEAHYPARMVARLLHRMAARPHARPSARSTLTRRERQVATLLEAGLSNKEIARRLSIELPTVKNHVHNILEKLGVSRRGEAVAKLRG
jgi:two-component system nitrate/nitrite response regulator NarL